MTPNLFAQVTLLLWAPLTVLATRRLSTQGAVAFILIGGVMFLPEKVFFILPLLPLDKDALSGLAALLVCGMRPKEPMPVVTRASRYLLFLLGVGTILTTLTNGEPLQFGPLRLPGLKANDAAGLIMIDVLQVIIPFHVGQLAFRTTKDLQVLLRALAIGALIYLPLVLLEARFSPILHSSLYGFFQHSFGQAKRAGGFRAFVFMQHGLAVAFYMSQAFTIVVAFLRLRDVKLPIATPWAIALLAVGVVSCKSLGALGYALITAPLVLFTSPKMQLRVMCWLSVIIMLYPLLRLEGWFPTDAIVQWALEHNPDRGRSLDFRIINEEMLLERAHQKMLFGWGSWGRNRVFDEGGVDNTTVDGEWIAIMGMGGIYRFTITFGSILLPVFLAARAARTVSSNDARLLALAAIVLTFAGVEMLPNSIWYPLPYLVAGATTCVCRHVLAARAGAARARQTQPLPG